MGASGRRSLQELTAEVATNPNSTAFVELAAAYRERGDLERALRLCLRGLERHPTHVEAHFELGRIYEARGDRELALDEWGIVRQLAPDHLPSRIALVGLYLDEARLADAEVELREAQSVAASHPTVKQLRQRLEAASRDGRDSEEPPALDPFDSLAREFPGLIGVLLADQEGQLLKGRMTKRGAESDRMLAVTLSGARKEADRVANYLGLGDLKGIVIESSATRLTVAPVQNRLVIVAMASHVPAGRSALAVRRAEELAEVQSGDGR